MENTKPELKVSSSPHIRDSFTSDKTMLYVMIALLPAMLCSIYFFGIYALIIYLVSILSANICESLVNYLFYKKKTFFSASGTLTAILLAMVIPPTIPLLILALGNVFAILIVKHCFGGLGKNIFNPALASRAFLQVSFPMQITAFIPPLLFSFEGWFSLSPAIDAVTRATPLVEKASLSGVFFGNISGSLGETSALLLILGGIFLILTKVIDWQTPVSYIATVFLLAFFIPGTEPLYYIFAGGLIIGAFFMATDYVTSPLTKRGKFVFGIGCGVLTVIIRTFSSMPEGVCYAILLMNAFCPLIDRFTVLRTFGHKLKKR